MTANATPILECRNLSVSYATRRGDVPAVVDFNLSLMPGEAHGLVGESGCGKSTVALAVMRYLGRAGRVAGGEVWFDGRNLLALSPQELRKIRGAAIAMIYQEPMASLNPAMPVGAQLIEVPVFHEGLGNRAAHSRARDMLERVRLPDVDRIMRSYPHQMSGGQQQRVVIAMALLSKPRLLLLDEPTTALDVTVEAGIVDLIRDISAEFGTSMLYISHNLGLILETCDRITVMYSGEAVETGPVATVFTRMRHPYTRGLFASIPALSADKHLRPLVPIPGQLPAPQARPRGCNFGPRCASFAADACDVKPIPMVAVSVTPSHASRCVRLLSIDWDAPAPRAMAPAAAAAADGAAAAPYGRAGSVALKVTSLSKRFERVLANDRLTFDAYTGETVAIVGESGCGKSTFAKILMGLESATAGSVECGGLELATLPVARRSTNTLKNLQMVFQNPFDTLNPSRKVGAQIGRVIRKFGIERDAKRVRERVLGLLDTVKLPREVADLRPGRLSGGQKQRIGIARAFAGNPALVVADEPVSALDVSVQAAITELLLQIQRRERSTLLFISHDLSVVRYLADRIVVMYLGRIMEQGSTAALFAPPYHPYTEALLSAVPIADPRILKRRVRLAGEIPSAADPPAGCPFCTRCPYAIPGICESAPAPVHEFADAAQEPAPHTIACHLPRNRLLDMQPIFGTLP